MNQLDQLRIQITKAKAAHFQLAETPLAQRIESLRKTAQAIESARSQLMAQAVSDGRLLHRFAELQVAGALQFCRHLDSIANKLENRTFTSDGRRIIDTRVPYGVVGIISPGNGPYNATSVSILSALVAGNSAIVRPPVHLQSCLKLFLSCIVPHWPTDSVCFTEASGEEASREFCENPDVAVVVLYGGVALGKKIALQLAQAYDTLKVPMKKIVYELGGNDPVLVFQGADLKFAAESIICSSFMNSGQACISGKRILVERPVIKEFLEILVAGVMGLKTGSLADPHADIGPLIKKSIADTTMEQLNEARQFGKVLCGGTSSGDTVAPTLVLLEKDALRAPKPSLWFEECFGPVRAVVGFDRDGEAFRMAEETTLGLGAGLFGPADRCLAFAQRLRVGRVIINENPADPFIIHAVPVGGVKDSGLDGAQEKIEALTFLRRTLIGTLD